MNKRAYFADFVYYNEKPHENVWLMVDADIIAGISEQEPEGYQLVRKEHSAIFPGLINTHTHLPMGFFRGMADDLPLMDWLQNHIWPAEGKWLSDEFVYDATQLAAVEMIKSGCTCAADMYFYSGQISKAMLSAGLKAVVGVGVLDFPTKFAMGADEYLEKAEAYIEEYKGKSQIEIAICPHAPYTASPETFKKAVALCEKHDVLLHTHLAETAWEVGEITEKYGKSPALLMDETGAFDLKKSLFAHCVHLSDEEIALMGKKKVNVAHCLESNLKLASGFAPVHKLRQAGANVTIGTDGAASNNDLDMLSEMSAVAKFHKGLNLDPTVMKSREVLDMATGCAAKALGLSDTGILAKGKKADFIIVSFDDVHMIPVYNHISHLIYSAKKSDITDVYVNGRGLMVDGIITVIDERDVYAKARDWAKRIKAKH